MREDYKALITMLEYIAVIVGPLVVVGIIMYGYIQANLTDISKNWVQYRCNPVYMPFTSMFSPDVSVSDNFSYCTNLFAKAVFDYATAPVYLLLSMFQEMTGSLLGDINQFLGFLAGIDKFIFEIANTVFGKIQNTFSVLTGQLGHVRDVMNRISSSAYYAVYIVSTMVSFMFSTFGVVMATLKALVETVLAIGIVISLIFPVLLAFIIPLGASIGVTVCFHPETLVGNVPIKDVRVGSRIPGGKVTSVFYFDCPSNAKLYVYNGTIVSGDHLVHHNNVWMYVEDTGVERYTGEMPSYLVCLNTDTHCIKIGESVFADYEEVGDPKALAEIEQIVWGKQVGQNYPGGIHDRSTVNLLNGKTLPLSEVRVGTHLKEGRVTGIVMHSGYSVEWYSVKGCLVSGCQPVCVDGQQRLAKEIGIPSTRTPSFAVQLFIDGESAWFTINDSLEVRDYPDSHDAETLDKIQDVVLEYLNKK
jgi:hypothetical protein